MRSIACLILFVAVGCAGETAKEVQPKNEAPAVQEEAATPVVPGGGEEEEVPTEAAPGGDCVKECVAARQMQATSIEQIEADCQAQCSKDESATLPQ